jgi:PleD family two-component response regulator
MGYEVGLVTASVGVAEFNPSHPSDGDLLVVADRALYQAKAGGRNTVGISADGPPEALGFSHS